MKWVTKFLETLRKVDCHDLYDPRLRQGIRLVNILSFIFFILSLPTAIIYALNSYTALAVVNFSYSIVFVLVAVLNKYCYFMASRLSLLFGVNSLILTFRILIGRPSELDMFLVVTLATPFVLFSEKSMRAKIAMWLSFAYPASALILFEFFDPHFIVLPAELHRSLHLFTKITLVIAVATQQLYWVALNTKIEGLLTSILEHLPLGFQCKDVNNDYRLIYWNVEAEKQLGLKCESVLGKTPSQMRELGLDEIFLQKATEDRVKEVSIKSSAERDGFFRTRRFMLNQDYLIDLSEDITEEKEKEVALMHSSKMISLGEMASGVAHEINNPLAIIKGNVSQLQRSLIRENLDSKSFSDKMKVIDRSVDRIADIIKGLRMFSQDAQDELFQNVLVKDVLDSSLSICKSRFQSFNIDLNVFDYPPDLSIICKPTQISQVLVNLLSNSFDSVSKKDTDREVNIQVEDFDTGITISVIDNGSGIDEEISGYIFQPFFTTKPVGSGKGLGLSISKGIINSHNGTINFTSLPGQTIFTISLPKTPIDLE